MNDNLDELDETQDGNWNDAIRQQQMQERQKAVQAALLQRQAAANERRTRAMTLLAGRAAVIDATQKERARMEELKNDTLSSLVIETRANGGFLPAELLGATSRSLGRQITGAMVQNGKLIVTSPADITDPKTGRRFRDNYAPYAMVDEAAQLGALQKSMLAPKIQSELWQGLVRGGMTPNELTARGLHNPDGAIQVGQTVNMGRPVANSMNGNLTTGEMTDSGAKPGRRPYGGAVSYFAADGKGGFSRGSTDYLRGEEMHEDYGTRAKDAQGRWKLVVSGQGNKTYENSQTGERVTVKDGENLRDAVGGSNSALSKAKVNQVNADARLKNAQAANGGVSGLTFEQRKELEQMRLDAADKREKGRNDLRSRLGQIKGLDAQIKSAEKELSIYQGGVEASRDPDKDKKIAAYRQKIDGLTAKRDQLFEVNEEPANGQATSAQGEEDNDMPYVNRGMLSIPGVDNWIAPNTEFEVNGKKYIWDGSQEGDLKKHIRPL